MDEIILNPFFYEIKKIIDTVKKYEESLKMSKKYENTLEFFQNKKNNLKCVQSDYQKILHYIHIRFRYIKPKLKIHLENIIEDYDRYIFTYNISRNKNSYSMRRVFFGIKNRLYMLEVFYAREIRYILDIHNHLIVTIQKMQNDSMLTV
jgi:hypothetical protein